MAACRKNHVSVSSFSRFFYAYGIAGVPAYSRITASAPRISGVKRWRRTRCAYVGRGGGRAP